MSYDILRMNRTSREGGLKEACAMSVMLKCLKKILSTVFPWEDGRALKMLKGKMVENKLELKYFNV